MLYLRHALELYSSIIALSEKKASDNVTSLTSVSIHVSGRASTFVEGSRITKPTVHEPRVLGAHCLYYSGCLGHEKAMPEKEKELLCSTTYELGGRLMQTSPLQLVFEPSFYLPSC